MYLAWKDGGFKGLPFSGVAALSPNRHLCTFATVEYDVEAGEDMVADPLEALPLRSGFRV